MAYGLQRKENLLLVAGLTNTILRFRLIHAKVQLWDVVHASVIGLPCFREPAGAPEMLGAWIQWTVLKRTALAAITATLRVILLTYPEHPCKADSLHLCGAANEYACGIIRALFQLLGG